MEADRFDLLTLFDNLSPAQSLIVKPLFQPVDTVAGTVLFEQDDPVEFLFILAEGEVLIQYKPDDGPTLTIARVKPEGVVGWSAALGSPHYTSSAVCSIDSKLLQIRGEALRRLCSQYPEIGAIVLECLADVISNKLHQTRAPVMALLEQGLKAKRNKSVDESQFYLAD